jgi:hypothetical protein
VVGSPPPFIAVLSWPLSLSFDGRPVRIGWRCRFTRCATSNQLQPIEPPGDGFLRAIKTAVLTSGMLALAMTSGCFAMAAPMAIDVARAAVSGISPSGHATKNNNDQIEQNTELCDMAGRDLPRLIELKTDNLGTTMYRTLNPGRPVIQSQLQQGGGNIGGPDEWRAMGDLAGMHFQPPLQKSQLAPGLVIFLAYAPSQVHDPLEHGDCETRRHDQYATRGRSGRVKASRVTDFTEKLFYQGISEAGDE